MHRNSNSQYPNAPTRRAHESNVRYIRLSIHWDWIEEVRETEKSNCNIFHLRCLCHRVLPLRKKQNKSQKSRRKCLYCPVAGDGWWCGPVATNLRCWCIEKPLPLFLIHGCFVSCHIYYYHFIIIYHSFVARNCNTIPLIWEYLLPSNLLVHVGTCDDIHCAL